MEDQWRSRAKSTRHRLIAGVLMVDIDVDLKRLCSQVDCWILSHRISPQPLDKGLVELRIACVFAQLRRGELSSKEIPSNTTRRRLRQSKESVPDRCRRLFFDL